MKSLIVATKASAVLTASDTRQYYKLEAQEQNNPFGGTGKRNIFQQFTAKSAPDKVNNDINPAWVNVATPDQIKAMIASKTPFPGEIATREVEPYTIPGSDRILSTYTAIVFSRESVETVFKRAGHALANIEMPEAAPLTVESETIIN